MLLITGIAEYMFHTTLITPIIFFRLSFLLQCIVFADYYKAGSWKGQAGKGKQSDSALHWKAPEWGPI